MARFRNFLTMAVAITAACCVPAADAATEPVVVPDGAVCVVYDQQVTRVQLDQLMESARLQYTDNHRTFPAEGTAAYRQLEADALDYLVTAELLRHAATQFGITVTDAEVEAARTKFIADNFDGSEAKYQAELVHSHYTDERVREDLRFDLLSRRVYDKVTVDVPKSTDAQALQHYTTHRGKYRIPRSRVIGHILVATRARALALHTALQGKSFAEFQRVARRSSLDTDSAPNGGRMKIFAGQTVPAFDTIAFSLRTGQLSAAFHTAFGWHLVFAAGNIVPGRQQAFREVRLKIRAELDGAARQKVYGAWMSAWRQTSASSVTCVPEHPWSAAASS